MVILACSLLGLLFRSLAHSYLRLPAKELRRRATRGKALYQNLYMVAVFADTARIVLGILTFIFGAAAAIAIARHFDPLIAFILLGILVGLLTFAGRRESGLITKLAGTVAPYLSMLLRQLEPVSDILQWRFLNHRPKTASAVYDKDDLKDFIEFQKRATHNRIDHRELDSALKALDFGSKKIRNHMVSREEIRYVTPKDPIGPVLLSELHKSGHTCFPVQGNSPDDIVGMLELDGLTERTEGGSVAEAMDKQVLYVHEDENLAQVMQAYDKTGRRVYIVVDDRERVKGLISINDVLQQLLGELLRSDFEDFDSKEAVAQRRTPSDEE